MLDLDHLPTGAYERWSARLLSTASTVVDRAEAVKAARSIPESGVLPIGTGRHMQAAVLFLDISGFSATFLDTAESQQWALKIITVFFSEIITVIEDYGGVVEKNTGDGLMAYFQDSVSRPDAKTATACALTIFYLVEDRVQPLINRVFSGRVPFRICIDCGGITVAEVGSRGGFRGIVAIGTAANIAAKMLGKAEPGQLMLGETAAVRLPKEWRQWLRFSTEESGFEYRESKSAYRLYVYDGRWTAPR